jgi:hypothetical protein
MISFLVPLQTGLFYASSLSLCRVAPLLRVQFLSYLLTAVSAEIVQIIDQFATASVSCRFIHISLPYIFSIVERYLWRQMRHAHVH